MEPGTHAQFTPSGSQLQEGLLTSPKMAWVSDLRATPKENFQIKLLHPASDAISQASADGSRCGLSRVPPLRGTRNWVILYLRAFHD
jgi:hypothetical protein